MDREAGGGADAASGSARTVQAAEAAPNRLAIRRIEAFDRLKRQLAAYRVGFGQPRQEDLVTLLDRAGVDVARLRDWAVDLSPPVARGILS